MESGKITEANSWIVRQSCRWSEFPRANERFLATDGHRFRVVTVVEWFQKTSPKLPETQDVNPA